MCCVGSAGIRDMFIPRETKNKRKERWYDVCSCACMLRVLCVCSACALCVACAACDGVMVLHTTQGH